MNKVYVLPPREDWIIDRLVNEWNFYNSDISVTSPVHADVVWLLADFCWLDLANANLLKNKKVITTIHHIVPEKFGHSEQLEFAVRDKITTVYHVPNQYTLEFIRIFTNKPIHVIPYWANQDIWRHTGTKQDLRGQYGLPQDDFLIGSFQRDTEGRDLVSPKLEKGPDLLADYIINHHDKYRRSPFIPASWAPPQVHVVLAGWRRQYIIKRLEQADISYSYFERPTQSVINDLYQTLDLYPVTSRHEGGPQSLVECGLLNVLVVSRPVGIADIVLPASAINTNLQLAKPAVPNVRDLMLPMGFASYRNLIESLLCQIQKLL